MTASPLTPEEYELHLRDLRARLVAYAERGEGGLQELLREAEHVLALREQFPEAWERHADVEGLVAELLARHRQQKVLGTPTEPEPRGCLLGWLGRRK